MMSFVPLILPLPSHARNKHHQIKKIIYARRCPADPLHWAKHKLPVVWSVDLACDRPPTIWASQPHVSGIWESWDMLVGIQWLVVLAPGPEHSDFDTLVLSQVWGCQSGQLDQLIVCPSSGTTECSGFPHAQIHSPRISMGHLWK